MKPMIKPTIEEIVKNLKASPMPNLTHKEILEAAAVMVYAGDNTFTIAVCKERMGTSPDEDPQRGQIHDDLRFDEGDDDDES